MILEVREATAKRSATCPKSQTPSDHRSVEIPSGKRIPSNHQKRRAENIPATKRHKFRHKLRKATDPENCKCLHTNHLWYAGIMLSGEGGIRTPGEFPHTGFRNQHNRPLCHLSVRRKIESLRGSVKCQHLRSWSGE